MSILDYKILSWIQSVSSLQDQPNQPPSSMTAAQLKAAFDSNSEQLKDALNSLIDALEPSIEGAQALFIAEYGVTTTAEIEAAYQAGNFVVVDRSGKKGILTQRISATEHEFTIVNKNTYETAKCASDSWSGYGPYTLAPVMSPNFTGTPKAPTPTAGDNSTKIATTAFVKNATTGLDNVFIAEVDVTTYAEVAAAIAAKKAVFAIDEYGVFYTYADEIASPFRYVFTCIDRTTIWTMTLKSNDVWGELTFEQFLISASFSPPLR